MTSDQIKKLAAAGLTVEQIAVVADILNEALNEQKSHGSLGGSFFTQKPPGARDWPGKEWGLPEDHLLHITRPEDKIETKVQHGELTVWPERKGPVKKTWPTDNNSVTQDH